MKRFLAVAFSITLGAIATFNYLRSVTDDAYSYDSGTLYANEEK